MNDIKALLDDIYLIVLMLLIILGCHGCALMPDAVGPELEHMSHLSQHRPFADEPTHYAANIVGVTVHWDVTKQLKIELSEGVTLQGSWRGNDIFGTGEIEGPREQFSGRIQYLIGVK